MTAGLYGLLAAFGWGGADFIARFTSRAIGHQQALFGMMAIGMIALSLIFWWYDIQFIWNFPKLWLLLFSGILIMVSTMLLYQALALGPVTIVAPIVGSYPVFNMVLAIIMGTRPNLMQWLAISSVLAGVWVVGYASGHFLNQPEYNKKHLRRVVLISLCSALGFGIFIATSQAATHYFGALQTIYLSRGIGLIALGLLFIRKHLSPVPILKSWRMITLQGLLDTGAVTALTLAAWTENAEIAVVTSSGFCVVTILLARFILHEKMSWTQWAGVGLIVSGVSFLSMMN